MTFILSPLVVIATDNVESDLHCSRQAEAGCMQPLGDRVRGQACTGGGERPKEEEQRDQTWVCQGHSLGFTARSMAPCQCYYVGVCSGCDTLIQALVRRPPTPDTRKVPAPDVATRQVRQETDQSLPATCQSPSHTITSPSSLSSLVSF